MVTGAMSGCKLTNVFTPYNGKWQYVNVPIPAGYTCNVSFTGGAYLAAGGFADVPLQEDVALVRGVVASGRTTASTARAAVLTSARTTGRLEGGFATYLRDRVLAPPPVQP